VAVSTTATAVVVAKNANKALAVIPGVPDANVNSWPAYHGHVFESNFRAVGVCRVSGALWLTTYTADIHVSPDICH
jgi:hypothetical protein